MMLAAVKAASASFLSANWLCTQVHNLLLPVANAAAKATASASSTGKLLRLITASMFNFVSFA